MDSTMVGQLLLSAALAVFGGLCFAYTQIVSPFLVMLKIPSPPSTNLLLGHVGVLDSERAPYLLLDYAKRLGGRIFRLRVAHLHVVIVSDASEAARLLNRGDGYLDKALDVYAAFDWVHSPPTPTIVTLPTDEAWRAIRKAVAPCFTSSNLKTAFPLMLQLCQQVSTQIEAMGPNSPLNFAEVSKRLTLDIIAQWGFASNFNASRDLSREHPVVLTVNNMVAAVHTVLSDPLWKLKRFTKTVQDGIKATRLYDAWMEEFAKGLRARTDLPTNSIGAALMRLDDPALGGKLDMAHFKGNAAILVAAGYETTANAIAICLVLLTAHPEWLRKLEDELDAAGLLRTSSRREPRELALDDLGRLPVLNAIIKETLRLMPSAGLGSFRTTTRNTEICGHTVPRGTLVILAPYVIDNSALSYGSDAESFNPGRWLAKGSSSSWAVDGEEAGAAAAGPTASLKEPMVFSMGPRDCVGQALARMELQVFLAMLVSCFRLHLAPSMGSPQDAMSSILYHLTFTMAGGLWMTAEPR